MATQAKPIPEFKKHKHSLESKQRRYGYLFTLPFVIGCIVFVLYPLVEAVLYSFSDVSYVPGEGLSMSNFGMQNYQSVLGNNQEFKEALLSSLGTTGKNVVVVVVFAFFMASVLNTKFIGRGFVRSIMFLPVIISTGVAAALMNGDLATSSMAAQQGFAATGSEAAVSTTFGTMLTETMGLSAGLVNFIMDAVKDISNITTLAAVSIVIFLAGLQSISGSIYEAAYMEGATAWETFWKISLPMVSPMILLSVVYTIVDSFTATDNAVIGKIHNVLMASDFAPGSTMAVIFSLIVLVVIGIIFAILSKIIFYQD